MVFKIVSYFMAEDGGESIFAGAYGEDTAEDEDFASVSWLDVLITGNLYSIENQRSRKLMTYPGRTKAFFCSLSPITLTSQPS